MARSARRLACAKASARNYFLQWPLRNLCVLRAKPFCLPYLIPVARPDVLPETHGKRFDRRSMARVRIMGLDPGLARMGWGAIEIEGARLIYVAHGVLTTDPNANLAARLLFLHDALLEVLYRLEPQALAIEQAFVHKDPSAAMKIGQARAVAMLAGARTGLHVAEYTPNLVKKCVVGAGHAGKEQVKAMVRRLLPGACVESADAADALALAIAHAHLSATQSRIAAALA
jgi:crossover junction endodeoxyribonuclease RuvC